jgi:hypothetical protein
MSEEKADIQRWMQERVDEIRRSQSGAAPDRNDSAHSMFRPKPVFGVPHPPPAIHHDDHPPEREVPIYRPFRASLPRDGQPSPVLAAFRLGHLGVSMWVRAEVLWEDLVRRTCHMPCHDGAMKGIPLAVDELLEARRVLADSIDRGTYDELARAVDRFSAFNRETIDQYVHGTFGPALHLGGDPPWESMWEELVFTCGRALAGDHPLRGVFDLGVAFGEFDRLVSRFYADPGTETIPEIRDLALRAASIPEAILARSPLLDSLARIVPDYDRIGNQDALLGYCKANRETWEASGFGSNSFMIFRCMASAQVDRVERDLGRIPAEDCEKPGERSDAPALEDAGGRPVWNKKLLILMFNGRMIRRVRCDAAHLIKILDVFQEEDWGTRIDNPIGGAADSQGERLVEAVRTLNNNLLPDTIRFHVIDKNSITWEISSIRD